MSLLFKVFVGIAIAVLTVFVAGAVAAIFSSGKVSQQEELDNLSKKERGTKNEKEHKRKT